MNSKTFCNCYYAENRPDDLRVRGLKNLSSADLGQFLREPVFRGEHGRQIGSQCGTRGARQRGQIDQQLGSLAVGLTQRIGEYQPAFGVGVADLNR